MISVSHQCVHQVLVRKIGLEAFATRQTPVDELGLHLGPNLGQGAAVGLGAEGTGQHGVRSVLVGSKVYKSCGELAFTISAMPNMDIWAGIEL